MKNLTIAVLAALSLLCLQGSAVAQYYRPGPYVDPGSGYRYYIPRGYDPDRFRQYYVPREPYRGYYGDDPNPYRYRQRPRINCWENMYGCPGPP